MDTSKQVKRILWLILFLNLGVAIAKIIAGTIAQSASMVADGVHSVSDGTSNVVALIGLAIAAKPVDDKHPYGHGKFEVLTSLFIGAMLLVVAGGIMREAYARVINPVRPEFDLLSIAVLVITLIINIGVCTYEAKRGRELNSYLLIADAMHTKSDIFVSLGVLGSIIAIKCGAPTIIDPVVSALVGCFIIAAAIDIIRATGEVLADRAALDHDKIEQIVRSFPEVLDMHRIRSRGNEPHIFLDMHIKLDPLMALGKAHGLAHDIEDKIKAELSPDINVTIHMEPYRGKCCTDEQHDGWVPRDKG